MIRINVKKENDKIKKITLYGHADYQEYGKDIVCAAVSATYICTVNAILSFDNKAIEINNNDDLQEIVVINDSDITITLLDNMVRCLESLERQYPKNVNLDKEEK